MNQGHALNDQGPVSQKSRNFSAYFGYHNSLHILATPMFEAIKLRSPLGFSYIQNKFRDQLFKTSGLQFENWLFAPEKFSELSRNRPLARVARRTVSANQC